MLHYPKRLGSLLREPHRSSLFPCQQHPTKRELTPPKRETWTISQRKSKTAMVDSPHLTHMGAFYISEPKEVFAFRGFPLQTTPNVSQKGCAFDGTCSSAGKGKPKGYQPFRGAQSFCQNPPCGAPLPLPCGLRDEDPEFPNPQSPAGEVLAGVDHQPYDPGGVLQHRAAQQEVLCLKRLFRRTRRRDRQGMSYEAEEKTSNRLAPNLGAIGRE